jgi:repressor LexA
VKLTEKQREFLAYVSGYIEEWGAAPTYDEIRGHFGFSSYNTVTGYLKILERKGYIRLPSEKSRKRAMKVLRPVETRRFECPLLGKVAAGRPIEAVEDMRTVEVPPAMTGRGEHFVLRVEGDSMIEDGILDGDYIVVRKQPVAENGEIVVALVNNEVTVKRYYRRDDQVELRPAHKGMRSFVVRDDSIHIEGKVVGVLRYCR